MTTHGQRPSRAQANNQQFTSETALVGALTAFAKSPRLPPQSTGPSPKQQQPSRRPSAALTPPHPNSNRQIKHEVVDEAELPSTASLVRLFENQGRNTKSAVNSVSPKPSKAVRTSPKPLDKDVVRSPGCSQINSSKGTPKVHTSTAPVPLPQASPQNGGDSREVALISALRPTKEQNNGGVNVLPDEQNSLQSNRASPRTHSQSDEPSIILPLKLPYAIPQASTSNQSIAAQYNKLHPRRPSFLKTEDAANAIVASSLASSRAPSPSKPPALPLRAQRSFPALHKARTPSPPRKTGALRQTLRKDPTSSESSESDDNPYNHHKKKRHIRKHPNKHHEGDRKRWRDAVTERERKRYEGVWATNKGILCTLTAQEEQRLLPSHHGKFPKDSQDGLADQVSALVVRDIWSRSRLPTHVLEEVWNLVDTAQVGRLSRDEFVVGMWLVDQRLKGRKLPVKVSDSVWNSARLLQGIKMRSKWSA